MSRLLCSVIFVIVSFIPAITVCQSSVQVVTSLVKAGQPAPQVCIDEVKVFRSIEAEFPHPNTWKWVMVCDEDSWKTFLTQAKLQANLVVPAGAVVYGETDIDHGISFLRGTVFMAYSAILSNSNEPTLTAEQLVAHELAHIALHSRDEAKVDAQATQWIKERRKHRDVILAQNSDGKN